MTNKELIEHLSKLPMDATVRIFTTDYEADTDIISVSMAHSHRYQNSILIRNYDFEVCLSPNLDDEKATNNELKQ